MKKNLLFYSINSFLSYKINELFYNDTHFVWIAPYFNTADNPYSSNPMDIFLSNWKGLSSRDHHCDYVQRNKIGICAGAEAKFKEGIISEEKRSEIIGIVHNAELSYFNPLIYIIPAAKVRKLVEEVPIASKANPFSREYMIRNLKRKDFDIIQLNLWT